MADHDFDVIEEAEAALEDGASCFEVAQRFTIHALRFGRLSEFDNLLASYDQDAGRLALLEVLISILDGEYVLLARELCARCRAKAAA